MDKPDVRALAEDVPAEVPDDVKRRAIAHSCVFADPSIQAFVERRIISAIMADRRATRETAKAAATTSNSEAVASEGDGLQDFRTTDTAALQQAADSLLHADTAAWKKGLTADDALVRHIAQARFQIGRVLQPVAAAKAEGRRQGLEEAAKVIVDGMKCRCCGAYFLASSGHDESDACSRPSWDGIPQEELPAAIRAIAQKAEG